MSALRLGHNGNLTNTARLASMNPDCPGTTDSELMLDAIAAAVEDDRSDGRGLESALFATLPMFEGAFSLVVMDQGRVIGVRDPHGFRPLCLGRLAEDGWVLASETAALDLVGASFVREVAPGEMVVIDATGIRSLRPFETCEPRLCLFEFVYFARPDSLLYGQSVQASRQRMGRRLAEEAPAEADVVVPVPESGIPAAQGFAAHSGIPYTDGLVKNRYIGRTFIEPSQLQRDRGIKLKLNPIPATLAGKRVVLVDDSIVQGQHHPPTRRHDPGSRRCGSPSQDLLASLPLALFLRDGHLRPVATARRADVGRRDRRLPRVRQPRLPLARGPAGSHRGAEAGFCTACLSGEYPTPCGPRSGQIRPGASSRLMASYRTAGVDLAGADRHVDAIADLVTATWGANVIGRFGGFAGGVALPPGYRNPVLMLTTDGVGTKLELARRNGSLGRGWARPGRHVRRRPRRSGAPHHSGWSTTWRWAGSMQSGTAAVVASVAAGCAIAAVPLLGGETAEHPGVMPPDQVDLAGAALGVVERDGRIDGSDIRPGDIVIGVASPNLRSNGFSLVRAILGDHRPG